MRAFFGWVRRHAAFLFGLLVLAGVVAWIARGGDPGAYLDLLRRADPRWLLLGIALQVGTYAAQSTTWRLVLRAAELRVEPRVAWELAVAKLFVDQVVPAGGVGGSALVIKALHRRGAPAGVALAAILVDLLGFYAAHAVAISVAALSVPVPRPIQWAAVGFVGLATVVPGTILWSSRGGAPGWLRRLPLVRHLADAPHALVASPRLVGAATLAQLAVVALDAGTLWCMLRGLGFVSSFAATWAAFVLAHVVAILGILPAGLGLFEGASVATLVGLAIPVEAALSATLLLRVMTLWLPMLPGLWVARRELAPAPP